MLKLMVLFFVGISKISIRIYQMLVFEITYL